MAAKKTINTQRINPYGYYQHKEECANHFTDVGKNLADCSRRDFFQHSKLSFG